MGRCHLGVWSCRARGTLPWTRSASLVWTHRSVGRTGRRGRVGGRGAAWAPAWPGAVCVAVSDAASARGHRTLAPGRVSTFGHARLSDIRFVKKSRARLVPSLRGETPLRGGLAVPTFPPRTPADRCVSFQVLAALL